jgi:hypothetical protein
MARALSADLRNRVVAAIAGGLPRRQAADRVGVSAASAIRWQKLVTQHGTPRSQQQGGDRQSGKIEARADLILGIYETTPTSPWRSCKRCWPTTKPRLNWRSARYGGSSIAAGSRAKKTAHATEQDRPDILKRREEWFDSHLDLDPERLVFIDER